MEPIEVVVAFARDMNDWEYRMSLLSRLENGQVLNHETDRAAVPRMSYEAFKNQYYEVFSRYCTKRKRTYGGHPTSWSRKGQYVGVTEDNVDSETVVNDNRVEVVVEGGEFPGNKFLFVVLKKAGEWRIDSAKSGDYGSWETHHL